MAQVQKRPVVLIVRDGWGHNPDPKMNKSNAVYLAKHPTEDMLQANYPGGLVATSGFDVGLPEGTMGNSEVGHQNIGAGRIVDQESVRITKAIRTGEFFQNKELNSAVDNALKTGGKLHLFGLVSDAGVHSLLEHAYACMELAKKKGLTRVYLHAFMDGRDTSPQSGLGYLKQAEARMKEIGVGQVASIIGRYWAMDRDNRWARVERAYRAMVFGDGAKFRTASETIQYYYDHPTESNMTGDEFITPSLICDDGRTPRALITNGDSVIFFNYRGDRPREITRAFVNDAFPFTKTEKDGTAVTHGFDRGPRLNLYYTTLTAYETGLPVKVAYPKPPKMTNILGEYLSKLGLKQFRSAETEKFPHVTFFFNDYREEPFPGEDRAMVPSPKVDAQGKAVDTYDQKPEMSAPEVCDEVVKRIDSGVYDLVVVNFANGDMVGHTGNLPAVIKAIETVDVCVGRILDAVKRQNGAAIITADHGNSEQEVDPETGGPHTAHTTFPVPLYIFDDRFKGRKLIADGRLADVAPTLLFMMGLPKPAEMTGRTLIAE